jgi:uncharacterized membrane protein YidH (DUF202 family)
MQRTEALWGKILGVLLIVLGITVFASPEISYTRRETVIHTQQTDVTAKRQKILVVPRPVAVLVVGVGIMALVLSSGKRQSGPM